MIEAIKPDARIFYDRDVLDVGATWQINLFESIDKSEKFIPLLSPGYLESKVCLEEYNIAWIRSRDEGANIIYPVYVRSAGLPSYMKLLQYRDCREQDKRLIRAFCENIV